MRSLYNLRPGGFDVLQVREEPDPVPGPGQVMIRVARAGMNFSDLMARMGLYPDAPKFPMVMGYEAAGTVAAVGPNVQRIKVGDRVLAGARFRAQATHLVVEEGFAYPLPEKMSFDEGAALIVTYLTAYHLLHEVRRVRPGDKILLHQAAGGVGIAVLQLCKAIGGLELFGTASAAKHPMLRELGVQHPIDYHTADFVAEVKRLTNGKGVDLILDAIGGPSWTKGYGLLAPAGQMIAFGFANVVGAEKASKVKALLAILGVKKYSPMSLMSHNRGVAGVNMLSLFASEELIAREMTAIMKLYEQGVVAPRVDKVFPLAQGAEAHRYLQSGKNVGKVLLDCT